MTDVTLHDEMSRARRQLEAAGIDRAEAAVDAELLARTVLGWDRARLLASSVLPAPRGFDTSYSALISRRERREPVAYIVGYREFWNRDFTVGPGVLVPRPETEIIVEESIARAGMLGRKSRVVAIADVGTGSGCLAVTLALEIRNAHVVATDISRPALAIAEINARRHGALERVDFVETSLLSDVDATFDLIVANPPYVPSGAMPVLPPEVREHEPPEALLGGEDGLDVIRELLLQAESRLRIGGLLIFEFGYGQQAGVEAAIAARPILRLDTTRRDLQGIPRTAVVTSQGGAN